MNEEEMKNDHQNEMMNDDWLLNQLLLHQPSHNNLPSSYSSHDNGDNTQEG